MSGGERTVWVTGLNRSVIKTVAFEDEEAAKAYLASTDLDIEASKIEFVPSGKSPEWLDINEEIRNYDQSKYEKISRSIDTDSDQ